MNHIIKRAWIYALATSKDPQGRYVMKSLDKKYDIFGVLCVLHKCYGPKDHYLDWLPDTEHNKSAEVPNYSLGYSYGGEYFFPPQEVLDWAGLDGKDPYVQKLVALSDNRKMTFKDLSDYIEKHL